MWTPHITLAVYIYCFVRVCQRKDASPAECCIPSPEKARQWRQQIVGIRSRFGRQPGTNPTPKNGDELVGLRAPEPRFWRQPLSQYGPGIGVHMTSYANELVWSGRPTIPEPSAQLAIRIPQYGPLIAHTTPLTSYTRCGLRDKWEWTGNSTVLSGHTQNSYRTFLLSPTDVGTTPKRLMTAVKSRCFLATNGNTLNYLTLHITSHCNTPEACDKTPGLSLYSPKTQYQRSI